MTDLGGPDIIMRCIKSKKGKIEEWPVTSFKSFLDLKGDSVAMASIELHCPVSHSFTLEEAVRAGIMPQAEAEKILAWAEEEFPRVKRDYEARVADGWRARPSGYIPNAEVVAKGWPCVKCRAPAKWAPFTSQDVTQRQENRALCLECRASWENFGTDSKEASGVFENSEEKPYWRPIQLFDEELWKRFMLGEPPATKPEAEALLPIFLKGARQEVKERARLRRKRAKT